MEAKEQEKGGWPHQVNAEQWHEISEADCWYSLEVLPPIYFAGGFAVSEPIRDDEHGEPVYLCIVGIGPKFYGRELPRSRAATEARSLRDGLCSVVLL
jgi:hypothetical protein